MPAHRAKKTNALANHLSLRCAELSFVLLFVFAQFAAGGTHVTLIASQSNSLEPTRKISRNTKFVSCFAKGHPTGSHIVSSPVLVSGSTRAYVEVAAIASPPKNEGPNNELSCENASRLFILKPGDSKFKLAYAQSPPDISDGNSLKLVDWAADGSHLLVERTIWGYETEGEFTDLLVFSLNDGNAITPDLNKIFRSYFGKECSSENSVLGFTEDGNAVVSVAPVTDTFYNEGATSCVKKKTNVALDANRSWQAVAQLLPADFKPQVHSHFALSQESKASH